MVRASYPGADAETIAATVATPIEQEINGVEDMLYMSSYSTSDGSMALTITFKLGTDLDKAQVLVQNRVSIAEPRLPEEVRRLGITTAKSSPDLMMVVHMLSPDDTLRPALRLQLCAQRASATCCCGSTASATSSSSASANIRCASGSTRKSSSAFGMTAGDVVQALRDQNVQVSGGSIGAPPNDGGDGVPVYGDDAGPLRRCARSSAT